MKPKYKHVKHFTGNPAPAVSEKSYCTVSNSRIHLCCIMCRLVKCRDERTDRHRQTDNIVTPVGDHTACSKIV